MSTRTKKTEIQETAPREETAVKSAVPFPSPCVYCGPSVRNVARQYTVYVGGVPEALAKFVEDHPEARGLMVPPEQFAQVRRELETPGTAKAILFQKLREGL